MLQTHDVRIAIIEDDEEDYFLISDYIKEIEGPTIVVEWCNNYEKALLKLKAREYDIYFVDYRLGKYTGLDFLQQASLAGVEEPIILLTGKGNKDIDIQAMRSGATDYLVKSELNTEKLERCIRYSLDRAGDLKELTARESKYRNLFENSRDGIFIADASLHLLELNHAARTMLYGLSGGEEKGNLCDFITNDAQRTAILRHINNMENVAAIEVEIESKTRQTKYCLLSLSFLENQTTEQVVHGLLHDITALKKAELVNLQSQKMAVNERLMQTLAHEIRNPLNNIALSLEHFPHSDDQLHLLDIMERNTARINHILTELLDITRPLELTFQKHSLQEIMDESLAMIIDRIKLQDIVVQKNYPELPLQITANKSKLILAFTNILVNAIEAMESGKGSLSVDLTEYEDANMVCIRDSGNGIPEEYLPKLFEPFFTLKKKGVGLGLSSSLSIFQSHKADVRVKSRLNEGTSFYISFDRLPNGQ
ncbi:MAG TPA: ATP-binding protein [Chitinophagaceae bacterium]|nr:ATP-binding protein [Chitinophagaceae bacterium]